MTIPDTVYIWSQRGQIPAMKMGKMWRYRRSKIDQWLRGRRNPPLEPAWAPAEPQEAPAEPEANDD